MSIRRHFAGMDPQAVTAGTTGTAGHSPGLVGINAEMVPEHQLHKCHPLHAFPNTPQQIPKLGKPQSVGERKVTATSLCPCSSKELLWLNPAMLYLSSRVLKGFYQFSFKLSYLFLQQILYEELTFGLAAMTNQGNTICPFL